MKVLTEFGLGECCKDHNIQEDHHLKPLTQRRKWMSDECQKATENGGCGTHWQEGQLILASRGSDKQLSVD
nr:hypothetical protein [Tanacetum cinerariifolium]